jgi:serine protease DegQ
MKRLWLLFTQAVTVALAIWFVVGTLKPQWLDRYAARPGLTLLESATPTGSVAPGSLSPAARQASPAVVSINTLKGGHRNPQAADPWFRFFFGDRDAEPQAGLGSGVIVSPEGYVLTNNHVIEGADEIEVILTDRRRTRAQVIGTDPDTDLAVLRISLDRLPVITWGKSEQLQVGDQVLAIGNPFGVGQTVTSGIVSALGRSQLGINTFENFIQTDAAINPGNSGGALVDIHGHLMGINTAIYSRSGGSMGIGFAIPAQTARQVLEGLIKEGAVTRGWIGVEPQDLSPELAQNFGLPLREAVVVTGVLQNGPAFRAGIQPGDALLSVGSTPVTNVSELLGAVAALKPGEAAPFKVLRGNREMNISVTPAQRPKPHAQRPR